MTFRRQYAGGATGQTLTAAVTSIATTAQISDNAGWPSGSVGPFAVVLDRGTNTEEKVLCSAQAGSILTITTRGYDGTAAWAHASGATAELCITAIDLDEANAHTSSASGVHFVNGSVVGTTDTQTLSNKNLVQPVIIDFTNANHDHSSAAQGGLITSLTHSGTVSLTPGSAVVTWAHGAPFTPKSASVFISAYVGQQYLAYYVNSLDATNMGVNFAITTSSAAIVTSCTVNYTVFA